MWRYHRSSSPTGPLPKNCADGQKQLNSSKMEVMMVEVAAEIMVVLMTLDQIARMVI